MLSVPHESKKRYIYSMMSDEGASGEQEKILRHTALEMAEALIMNAEKRENPSQN